MKRIQSLSVGLMLTVSLMLIGSVSLSRIKASIKKTAAIGDAGQNIAHASVQSGLGATTNTLIGSRAALGRRTKAEGDAGLDMLMAVYGIKRSQFTPTATLTVNSTADTSDAAPGNGICADALGNCTLRAAIEEANAIAGLYTIQFNIGTGTPTISPTSALPQITQPVIIDGNSGGATKVELNGASAGFANGLFITAGSSTVRNMVINRFLQNGILLMTNGNNNVEGNFIGTDATGTMALGNSRSGVFMDSAPNNTVGGTTAGAGNLISGNLTHGVVITDSSSISATGNKVEGNYIGTDVTGMADLGNLGDGVLMFRAQNNIVGGTIPGARNVISGNDNNGVFILDFSATGNKVEGNYIGTDVTGMADLGNSLQGVRIENTPNNTVGGTTAGARNVISGNFINGVFISGSGATGNKVEGNYIGTQADGSSPLPNSSHGVSVASIASDNTIGGTASGAGNIIAFNNVGVAISIDTPDSINNAILGNSIFSNTQLGIDLGDNGVTQNDLNDNDSGPNQLQNFPVIIAVGPTVVGTINSKPNASYRLEFFSSPAADASGFGEGQTFRGFANVTTDGAGNATFNLTFPTVIPAGHFVTATATDVAGNSSEFSQAVKASQPTAVEFASASATAYDSGVLIEWRTGLEVDNLGFNIYREEAGKRTRITPQLIAGAALLTGPGITLASGHSYAWFDTSAKGKDNLSYWIQDVDLNGTTIWHGPVFAPKVGGAPPAHSRAALLSSVGKNSTEKCVVLEPTAALPKATTAQSAQESGLANQPAVKLAVRQAGFYRVTAQELFAAGLDAKADPHRLQMFVEGHELPITVVGEEDGRFDAQDAVEFHGVGLDTAATNTRVYWLVVGLQNGQRIQKSKDQGQPLVATSFSYTVERKDRTVYFPALKNGDKENFFGAVIASEPVSLALTLQHLDQTSGMQPELEVALQGVTLAPHRVNVLLNGIVVTSVTFNGQAEATIKTALIPSLLREGDNQVELIAQDGPADVSLVNYVRLTYPHTYRAETDVLRLSAPGGQAVTIDGFTSEKIHVLDVTDPDRVQELAGAVDKTSGFAITVTPTVIDQRTLLAITDDQILKPVSITANRPSKWRDPNNGADFLIITRSKLTASLTPLVTLRQKQGLSVAMIDVEDIYDEFNYGDKSPLAIKDFLKYATQNWKKAPRFALLAADSSYDPKNYLGFGDGDLVPTKLIDTDLMETASDEWLGDFNGDGIAELALGRLPVNTASEADVIVAKLIAYDQSEPSNSVLLVADTNNGYDFERANAQLRALIPPTIEVGEIKRGQMDPLEAKSRLLEAIRRGQKLINYAGHGSVDLWSARLLTATDASGLMNGERLPVFILMTCLNGYFHDPALESLAESLLKAEHGGASAVWASSGLTLPDSQAMMNQQLYRLLLDPSGSTNKSLTIGEAIQKAKMAIGDADIRQTWILFGDPTMKLKQ